MFQKPPAISLVLMLNTLFRKGKDVPLMRSPYRVQTETLFRKAETGEEAVQNTTGELTKRRQQVGR